MDVPSFIKLLSIFCSSHTSRLLRSIDLMTYTTHIVDEKFSNVNVLELHWVGVGQGVGAGWSVVENENSDSIRSEVWLKVSHF